MYCKNNRHTINTGPKYIVNLLKYVISVLVVNDALDAVHRTKTLDQYDLPVLVQIDSHAIIL